MAQEKDPKSLNFHEGEELPTFGLFKVIEEQSSILCKLLLFRGFSLLAAKHHLK